MKLLKRSVIPMIAAVLAVLLLLVQVPVHAAATTDAVTGPNGSYATIAAAVNASVAGDTLRLNQDMTENVTIRKNLTLDLNGYDLNGTLTVSNGKVVTVKDSSTDDFDCAAGYGTVKATAGTGKVKAAEGYIAVTETVGTSYHRLDLKIHSVTLRPREAGIYYTGNFGGDQLVKAQIQSYGTILSVTELPTAAQFLSGSYQGKHTVFSGNSWVTGTVGKAHGTLLSGILKDINSQETNENNSAQQIHSVAYAKLTDGTVVFGEAVSVDLWELTENIDKEFKSLNPKQITALQEMYKKFKPVMAYWDIPNLRNSVDNQPVLALSDVTAKAGATVTVKVSLENNPGILGAIFSISYDSSVLTLTGATNGVTAEGVKYTAPARFKDPTTFVWDAMDPTWTQDGTVLTLTFKVAASATKGNYVVSLNYDPYDIFDANGDPIYFAVADATIEVK